ncbi:MAG: hypothetical protein ACKN9V_06865 [Pseudomonadota bacterium]
MGFRRSKLFQFVLLVCSGFLIFGCGQDFCILGQGKCHDFSSVATKKTLTASISNKQIFSNSTNGVTKTQITLTDGIANFTLSIPSTETAADIVDPANNSLVKSVTTSSRSVEIRAASGFTGRAGVTISIKDSDSPQTSTEIILSVNPVK